MGGSTQLPPPSATGAAVPAAAYVRMSTEHQQYSTENQLDRIKEYAARRGMEIVRVFEDAGKSGLNVRGRESLQKMIKVVESGQADFKCILAYDVSRWGRFQDADESGYYEYICKRAGITVHYCAKQFENDGSPTSNIIKSVNIERTHHQLAIDSSDPTHDVGLALSTIEFYGLYAAQAGKILSRVLTAVTQWRSTAMKHRLSRAEIELLVQAFPPSSAGN